MTVASIDIGTNTVLLLIAEVDKKSKKINPVVNEYEIPRIGRGLKKGNPFPEENIIRLFDVLKKYKNIIEKNNCDKVLVNATNAFRIASNSGEVCKKIKSDFGFDVNILSGDDESYYSFLGVSEYLTDNENLFVIDIGGGSTEIIYGNKNNILFRKSFNAGVVSGTENYFKSDPPTREQVTQFNKFILSQFKELKKIEPAPVKSIAIAGTPTTLAAIKQKLTKFEDEKVEGSTLTKEDLSHFLELFSRLSSGKIKKRYSQIINNREDIILAGTCILFNLLNIINLDKTLVSTKGIRFGAIQNFLQENNN